MKNSGGCGDNPVEQWRVGNTDKDITDSWIVLYDILANGTYY